MTRAPGPDPFAAIVGLFVLVFLAMIAVAAGMWIVDVVTTVGCG